jgi:hypothetical protein
MNRPNRAIGLMRGDCILYIEVFWHLLGYIDGIDVYKNALTTGSPSWCLACSL